MHKKLQKASTHFTKFFSRRPLNAADTLMVLSTLALFTAIPNSSSSTSESVCIVQAFVTVSILFRVRTLCPILYFQYILQNSEIICFQTDRFLSVILILSLVTIWQYQKTWVHFIVLQSLPHESWGHWWNFGNISLLEKYLLRQWLGDFLIRSEKQATN